MEKYNAILLGLGKIGSGSGIYSNEWNNHLFSLSNANWIDKIFLIDPHLNLAQFLTPKILKYDYQIIKQENKRLLYVDAGPAKNRINRVLKYEKILKPDLFFIEKPNIYNTNTLGKFPNEIKLKVNYYRRSLPSSFFLKGLLKNKKMTINFRFNNGLENSASHFFDFIDFLNFKLDDLLNLEILRSGRFIYLSNLICMEYVDEKKPLFEIIFKSNNTEIKYSDFGNKISKNKSEWFFTENKCRFVNIYNELKNLKKLTDFKKDVLIYKLLKNIKNSKIVKNKTL